MVENGGMDVYICVYTNVDVYTTEGRNNKVLLCAVLLLYHLAIVALPEVVQ